MSTVDVLITIPLIPIAPVVATWWLPWEKWLPARLPKHVLGPYFLYVCFAAWHFAMPWWVIIAIATLGTILTAMSMLRESEKNS